MGCARLVDRGVQSEHLVQTGDLEDLQDAFLGADDVQRTTIGPDALDLKSDDEDNQVLNLRKIRERAELIAIRRALARTQGNISKSSRLLGVSRPTLYDLLRQHGLRD